MRTWIVSVVFVAACGGKQVVAPAPEPEHHEDPAMEQEEASMPPALKAFHDVLAPIYHDEDKAERTGNACAQADQMAELAAKVDGGEELVGAVGALQQDCATNKDPDEIDLSLGSVHSAFHNLLDAKPQP